MSKDKITVSTLVQMKKRREKIAVLTSYDASFTAVLESAGVEVLLVGDSLGMVIQGLESTLPVTVRDMVYHTRVVARAHRMSLLIADMPFMSYDTPARAFASSPCTMWTASAFDRAFATRYGSDLLPLRLLWFLAVG